MARDYNCEENLAEFKKTTTKKHDFHLECSGVEI